MKLRFPQPSAPPGHAINTPHLYANTSRTVALSGDSLVHLDSDGQLGDGPYRVVPLCLLASEFPEVVDELRRQAARGRMDGPTGQFAMA